MALTHSNFRTPIPAEIYLSIFDYLLPTPPIQAAEDRAFLTALCLVCHAFCQMLRPRIFRTLEFTNKKANRLIPTEGSQAFCTAVISGMASATSLAQHVTECTLRDWSITYHAGPGMSTCLAEAYRRTLGLLPNLQVLNMTDMRLDEMMLRDISLLKGLRSLSLQNCVVARTIDINAVRALKPLRNLQHFYYKGKPVLTDPLYLDILRQIIDPTHLKTLHSMSWNVITTIFTNLTGHSSLSELNLSEAMCDPLLLKILTQSPRLKSLTIGHISCSTPLPVSFPISCVPDLEVLVCPPSMLSDFVPERPLHAVLVSGVSYANRVEEIPAITPPGTGELLSLSGPAGMEILSQSSIRPSTLRIPIQIFLAGVATRHFSSLKQLHLDFHHQNYDSQQTLVTCKKDVADAIRNMCKVTPRLPTLKTLIMSFGSRAPAYWPFQVDLTLQHGLVTSFLADTFPNVTTVTFMGLVRWNKTYTKYNSKDNRPLCQAKKEESKSDVGSKDKGPWLPEVLPGHRMVLAALSAAGCLKDTYDYAGTLRAALGAPLGIQ